MPSPAIRRPLVVLLLFLLIWPPDPASSLGLGEWRTLLSLSQSLLTRVANARAARGDDAAAERARRISGYLRLSGTGFWSLGWDFARNYAFSGGAEFPVAEISRAAWKLLGAVYEFRRIDSVADKAEWVARKSPELVGAVESVVRSLLRFFSQSGPMRDMVLVLQREMVEGELLKDCLEVGAGDLEGLLRIAKDFVSSSRSEHREL